ncbi:MAG: 16S rRNA (cytosine(1402)-N(4))-methyltransferase RsmH [Proteobacteria bacterium]|nr:16S rRNA (cytosine(1402)-N(4))-methyltransferase RsmH [Cystobacterineae bacterium]MCL2258741.1 16S rRNA (cytosine(1402)-N(4))-methyltransferase RsmH [Cystobacterineae bacterium]MCL2314307.1 16S rRNA (cytosine(1402)-N(4))-methyltransferase RsmH [Pseudomonadota bacterium]
MRSGGFAEGSGEHRSVLLEEVLKVLTPKPGKRIIDATLGAGGHTEALLFCGAQVMAIDQDEQALRFCEQRLQSFGSQLETVHGNFAEVLEAGIEPCDGLLMDLGISSRQLDARERGFSFQREGPLDMRMSQEGQTAAELIAHLDEKRLAVVLRVFGEERFAHAIARQLKQRLPQTTLEAVSCIESAVPKAHWPRKIHVATKSFQALRIAVNRELEALEGALGSIPKCLKVGGVVAIISFHSLEDRLVKQAFLKFSGREPLLAAQARLPIRGEWAREAAFALLTPKAIRPSEEEVAQNPRARSAKLRAIQRLV